MRFFAATVTVLALALSPAAATAALELAPVRALAAEGRTAEALERLERLLAGAPADSGGLFLKGVLLVELRRTGEAERIFERLVEMRPDMPEPYNNLAVIQAASGDYDAAVETLKRALQTNASYRTAYDNLTKIYGQLASQAYRQALSDEPVEPAEVVQLVLLGSLSSPPPAAPVRPAGDAGREEVATAAPAPAETAPAVVEDPGVRPAPEPVEPAAPVAVAEQPPAASATPAEPRRGEVAAAVRAWARAWSEQRVDDYLAAYSPGFGPPGGMSRSAWEAQRRDRLSRPSFIRVSIAFLDSKRVDDDRREVRFIQEYESNTFSDKVTKTLVLAWEDDAWKIVEERVEP